MDINPDILERLKDQQLNQDDSWLKRQIAAMKAMQDEKIPVVAKPELVADRLVSSFKMGALAGLFAAAVGGAAGAMVGVPGIGAALGGHYGLLGGVIKGQADANKRFLREKGFDPKYINIARFAGSNPGRAAALTTLLPDPGHLSV